MRVSELTRPKPTPVTVDLGDGDTLNIVFDRNRVTPAWFKAASDLAGADDDALQKVLAVALMSWDVTNDDGSPFPPTVENLSVLSFAAQSELLRMIAEAAVPGAAEGKASPVRSSTEPSDFTQPQPTSQNGQPTSPSPAPSGSPSLT